jgi:hypothetical protein
MKRDIWVFLFGLGVLLFGGPFLYIFRVTSYGVRLKD